MKNVSRRRPLAFEQMELRLALSATPTGEYILVLGNDLQLTTSSFGGVFAFDQVAAANFGTRGELKLNLGRDIFNFNSDSGFVDIVDGNFIFEGPVFSKPEVDGPVESNEAGSLVTPIPQPQLGDGEIAEGIVAVAEIFRPTKPVMSSSTEQTLVQNEVVETTVARVADESWKSTSLSRGRDMYFEVAALSDKAETSNSDNDAELSSKVTPIIYQQTLLRREAQRASSTTSEQRANAQQKLPSLPAIPQQESRPADSERSELPADDAAAKKSQRTAQDGETPKADDLSQADDAHDHVFAAWTAGEELGDEAIALRTESQQGHSATWPVLAALAATGWIARTRRATGVLPKHRRPLPRK